MQLVRRFGALSALVALIPLSAHAQNGTTHFNVAAGLSLATGTFGDRNDAGFNVAAGAEFAQRGSPISFRIEGTYNQFNEKGFISPFDGSSVTDASHAAGITLNGIYDFLPASSKQSGSFYGIGGIGYYSTREPFLDPEALSNFGWNIGAGFRFPLSGFSAYVEARYHSVSNVDATFLPITFGLVF